MGAAQQPSVSPGCVLREAGSQHDPASARCGDQRDHSGLFRRAFALGSGAAFPAAQFAGAADCLVWPVCQSAVAPVGLHQRKRRGEAERQRDGGQLWRYGGHTDIGSLLLVPGPEGDELPHLLFLCFGAVGIWMHPALAAPSDKRRERVRTALKNRSLFELTKRENRTMLKKKTK